MTNVSLREYNREIEGRIESGRIDEALSRCQHSLKTFPMYIETYRLLGKALLEVRRYSDAADIFQRILMTVPDDFVAHLKAQEGRDGLHEWAEPKIIVGERMRVTEGPLKGYEGVLLAKSGQARVMLLLDMLGKEVRTHLLPEQIEPADR